MTQAELIAIIEAYIEPALDRSPYADTGEPDYHPNPGYNCCGCSTLSQLYEDMMQLIKELD